MSGHINRPDCVLVDTWLDDWLDGRVCGEVARRIENHITGCERCRRLTSIVCNEDAGEEWLSPGDAEASDGDVAGLVAAVLARTAGSRCARAETLLPSLVDGDLDAGSREMLRAHVAHCGGCSRLLAALQEAANVLPGLAEIEPPPGFAKRVLLATSAAPRQSAFERLWSSRILARPRTSLELAYAGALLLVVLLGNPVAAFYQAEERATELAGAVPVARLSQQLGVADAAAGTIARMLATLQSVANTIQAEVAKRLGQARALMDAISAAIGNAIAWIGNIDVKQMLRAGGQPPPPRGQPAGAEPGARR